MAVREAWTQEKVPGKSPRWHWRGYTAERSPSGPWVVSRGGARVTARSFLQAAIDDAVADAEQYEQFKTQQP